MWTLLPVKCDATVVLWLLPKMWQQSLPPCSYFHVPYHYKISWHDYMHILVELVTTRLHLTGPSPCRSVHAREQNWVIDWRMPDAAMLWTMSKKKDILRLLIFSVGDYLTLIHCIYVFTLLEWYFCLMMLIISGFYHSRVEAWKCFTCILNGLLIGHSF